MNEDIARKIRSLEALATRPGTKEEGEIAKTRAIELSKKYDIPSIFTQDGYVPPVVEKPLPRPAPPPTRLHRNVVAMEARLLQDGWEYSCFVRGKRIYVNRRRPDETIQMSAYHFGAFSCEHIYKPSWSSRPAGNDATELDHFFGSMTYRHELWPQPIHVRPKVHADFHDPLFSTFDPREVVQEQSKPAEAPKPIVEETTPPEPPVEQPDPYEEHDAMLAEMLRRAEEEEREIRELLAEKLI